MRIIDLTHTISEVMPVYPGTETPKLEAANTYEKHGFRETLLTMYSHTGTHMDAPAHLVPGKQTLDEFHIQQFAGKGLVIDCSNIKPGEKITMKHLDAVKDKAAQVEFLLFLTGWDKHWGTDTYFGEYPVMTEEVADYLIQTGKKGVGLDTISIDPISDPKLTIHRRLFNEAGIVIIENLTQLSEIGYEPFLFCALPLKFEDSDGAPVRAIAIL